MRRSRRIIAVAMVATTAITIITIRRITKTEMVIVVAAKLVKPPSTAV